MDSLKKYKIDIADLSIGEREYDFTFDSDFFHHFENSVVRTGAGKIKVILNKTETFIELFVHIVGELELTCDRSLDQFNYPVDIKRELVVKFSDEEDSEDDDVIFTPWNAPTLNIAQQLYEFMSVEVPMKKLHPRYDQDKIDDELVYSSTGTIESPKEPTDPRWNKLKELKEKK